MSLNSTRFLSFFDNDSRLVKEHEFRNDVFKNGISPKNRPTIWKYLFEFYSYSSTPRERMTADKEKSIEYFLMKSRWKQIEELINSNPGKQADELASPSIPFNIEINLEENIYNNIDCLTDSIEDTQQINVDYIKLQLIVKLSRVAISNSKLADDIKQIDKDVERTKHITDMKDSKLKTRCIASLRNILITFSVFNQKACCTEEKSNNSQKYDLGYTQGMNELASVFLSVFGDESIAYWCFSNFMLYDTYSTSSLTLNTTAIANTHILKTNVAHYFSSMGMSKKLAHLSDLLKKTDSELYDHFHSNDIKNLYFCHEWLLLMFKRCFVTTADYLRCFEMLASHFLELHTSALKGVSIKSLYSFDLFICLSLLKQMRISLLSISNEVELFQVFKDNANLFSVNYDLTLMYAEEIFEKYCINMKISDQQEDKSTQKAKRFQFF